MKNKGVLRFRQIALNHIRQMKGRLLVAALCTCVLILTELAGPWPFKIILDHVLLEKPLPPALSSLEGLLESGKGLAVVVLSLSILLIAAFKDASAYLQTYCTSRIGHQMVYTIRRELFSHLQRLSLSFHNRARSGELLTKVTADTKALKNLFAGSIVNSATYLVILIAMCTIMLALSWQLSLIVLATLPVLFYFLFHRFRNLKASAKRQRKQEGRIASRISETLSSVALVQVFGQEKHEEAQFESASGETLEEGVRTARMEAATTRIVDFIRNLGESLVVLVGSLLVLDGRMTPGDILIFISYVGKLYKPINNLVRLSVKLTRGLVSVERISEIFDVEPEVQDTPDAIEAESLRGEIVFENVSFDYGDDKGVLRNVSFTISAGQKITLVGASGSGKSTIVCLIPRLFDPQEGSILIDGRNIKDYQRASLRRQIGVVLQDSILFGTSIRENIAYGKSDATEEEIVSAAKAANAHDFIIDLENGYDAVIGERGATLSGGERQRIAIARALMRTAPILILDEPMTGLDVQSEEKVLEALKRLMAGRTCLLVTHDLHVAAEVDLILVLENGRLVEQGSHSELMQRNGLYRQLYERKDAHHEAECSQ